MRQWGSSLNHNGMSVFLATVPEGQLLYHGGRSSTREQGPTGEGFDWLAFEVEHAQNFAASWDGRPRRPPGGGKRPPGDGPPPPGGPPITLDEAEEGLLEAWRPSREPILNSDATTFSAEKPMSSDDDGSGGPDPPPSPAQRGYFHTYRAARPLHLLYVDGMSAGKARLGCLDTQDYLLLGWPVNDTEKGPGGGMGGEMSRARELCALADAWAWTDSGSGQRRQIDGFVRAEAGFEIIYCRLGDEDVLRGGLAVDSIRATPFSNETGWAGMDRQSAEMVSAAARRYHGLPAGRVQVDWSSMVSAFFYDVNLTNPDAARPDLPRLVGTARDERKAIKARIGEAVAARGPLLGDGHRGPGAVDWQGVVDLIVSRYSERLTLLAATADTSASVKRARSSVDFLVNTYVDYAEPEPFGNGERVTRRCTRHYLEPALRVEERWTPEDRLVYVAVESVATEICRAFIEMRGVLHSEKETGMGSRDEIPSDDAERGAAETTREISKALMAKLQWTVWKECGRCPEPDQICLVAMFPFGSKEDHFSPSCKSPPSMNMRDNYWHDGSPFPY